jgi:hypothetical protein
MHPTSIELLEARIAPAGIIDVFRKGTSLIFQASAGADGDSGLTLAASGQNGLLAQINGTTAFRFEGELKANGASLNFADFFDGDVQVKLGIGDDSLQLIGTFPGNVKADLGPGTNSLNASNTHVVGNLTFKGGAGNDALGLGDTRIGGNLIANLAGETNSLNLVGSLKVGKNFTLTGTGQNDSFFANGSSVSVLGNVTMKVASGGMGFDVTESLYIGKNLSLTTKTGLVSITQRVEALGDVIIGGSVKLAAGATTILIQTLASDNGRVAIGGNVSMTSKTIGQTGTQAVAAGSAVEVGGSVMLAGSAKVSATLTQEGTVPSLIGGSVKMTGQSSVVVGILGTVAGSGTFVVGGDGAPDIQLDPTGVSQQLTFGKTVSISVANPTLTNSSILLENIIFTKGLKVKDGTSNTTLTMNDTSVAGSFTADLGAGIDTINLDTKTAAVPAVFYGPVLIKSGADNDMFRLTLVADASLVAWNTFVIDGGPGLDSVLSIGTTTFAVPVVKKNIEADL